MQTMRLKNFTDYTLRTLMFLALEPGRLATIPEIAAAYGISENHLTKVVHQLGRSGVIESLRGKGGGVRLALPPEAIRIGLVVRLAEGDDAIVSCLSADAAPCPIGSDCLLAGILDEAMAAFYAALDAYTLADLVTNRQALQRILLRA